MSFEVSFKLYYIDPVYIYICLILQKDIILNSTSEHIVPKLINYTLLDHHANKITVCNIY